MTEKKIELYTATWCPDCRHAKSFLDREGVTYESVDIEETPGAAEKLESATGKRGIPYLLIDGDWVQAYTPGGGPFPEAELREKLGLDWLREGAGELRRLDMGRSLGRVVSGNGASRRIQNNEAPTPRS